jgi:hypothetical protein
MYKKLTINLLVNMKIVYLILSNFILIIQNNQAQQQC